MLKNKKGSNKQEDSENKKQQKEQEASGHAAGMNDTAGAGTNGHAGAAAGSGAAGLNREAMQEGTGTDPAEGGVPEAGSMPAEEKLRGELQELNDKYLRLYAEFDNFKRRTAKERIELINTASKNVLLDLLPVLDDFDRALKSMETAVDAGPVTEGVRLIHSKFRNILSSQGLKEMEAVGQPFDPDIHEAVTNIPAPSEELKGKVVDEVLKGYYLNDKVIRFAKVIVGA